MAIGVAEINALAASRPGDVAQDLDSVGAQMRFPLVQLIGFHGKAAVDWPGTVVWRDLASRNFGTLCG